MAILVVLALISAGSWVVVFSKSARERVPWMWTIRARANRSSVDVVGKIILPMVTAIVTTLIVVFALINEYWTSTAP